MINMTPPGYQEPSLGSSWTRAKTMFLPVSALQQLAQSDDAAAASAAQRELQQRGISGGPSQVNTANHPAPVRPTPLQVVAGDMGTAGGNAAAQAILGDQQGPLPGSPTLQADTANHAPGSATLPPWARGGTPTAQGPSPDGGTPPQPAGMPAPGPSSPSEAIQQGVSAADQAASPLAGMSPDFQALIAKMQSADTPRGNPAIDSVAGSLMNNGAANPGLALAKAGFSMAASRNPFFFGALGEGANAGIQEYQDAMERQLVNRARAAAILQGQQAFGEEARKNRVGEAESTIRAQIATQNLGIAQQDYAEKVREFNLGRTDQAALKEAQLRLMVAQTAAASANAQESQQRGTAIGTSYGTDENGNMIRIQGAKATGVTDDQGNPVSTQKWGQRPNAVDSRAQILANAGWSKEQIAAAIGGGKAISQAQMMNAASNYAKNATANDYGSDASAHYQQYYDDALRQLSSPNMGQQSAAPASAAPNAPAAAEQGAVPGNVPAAQGSGVTRYANPDQVKQDYKAGKLTKDQAIKQLQQFGQ